jgi:hypothetical protein
MKFKIFNNKAKTILVLLTVSLISLTGTAQSGEKFKPQFSLKLTGGLGYMSGGDINTYTESLNNLFKDGAEYLGDSITGEIEKLNFSSDWEVELRTEIGHRFEIGLGAGYIHAKDKSHLDYIEETAYGTKITPISFNPRITAIPLKLGVYYKFPFIFDTKFFLNLGADYYFVQGSLYTRLEGSITDVYSKGAGFHGGIGIEYKLTFSFND